MRPTIVDRDEHHILCGPLLSVELRFCTPSFAIAATVNPQSHRQLLVYVARRLGIDVQIETVLTIRRLVAIPPLRGIETRIVNGLVTRMSETVTLADALPGHNRLGLFPTQVANGCCSIRDAFIDIHIRVVAGHTLNLTTLNLQHGSLSS